MKIGIIGTGFVGSASAFSLVLRGNVNDLVLIDINKNKAQAEALDILHATPFTHQCRIIDGEYEDLEGADIIIITAGVNQKPGESRLNLLERNAIVFKDIIANIIKFAADAIILVATNPVDVMTDFVIKESKLSPSRVFGSGTILDTSRFRTLLGEHLHLASKSIHAYVLGEHGDSEVLIWSTAKAGTMPVDDFAKASGNILSEEIKNEIDDNVRNAAYKIIAGKGATYYGIAGGIARICQAIADDENVLLTVSSLHKDVEGIKDVCLSLPTIINRSGIKQVIYPQLSLNEHNLLRQSAEKIKAYSEED